MAAMIFRVSPECGQRSMSISNSRFSKRAQLIHTETGGYTAQAFELATLVHGITYPDMQAEVVCVGAACLRFLPVTGN